MVMYYLNDRGIKEAVKNGFIDFQPKLEDSQIQPASIDLFFDGVEDYSQVMAVKEKPHGNDSILYPGFSTDVAATQSVHLYGILSATVELRSSLRRLGCYRRVPSVMSAGLGHSGYESFRIGLDIVNPANIAIKLKKGDKIAQMLVMFDGPTEKELLNDNIYFIHDKTEYRKYLDLDHGMEINETNEITKLSARGYFSIFPAEKFRKGFLEVHAAERAFVLKDRVEVDFNARKSLEDRLKEVSLPYKVKPGEFVMVDTMEKMDLSENIGIQFYNAVASLTLRDFDRFSKSLADSQLRGIYDGWVDPGYKGAFSRQPRTYYYNGVTIKKGDVLGYGRIIFFPNGVERSYGSKGLNSHYQNAERTYVALRDEN